MKDNTKKYADIVRALLAKAAGTDNEHEAEVFTSKAEELMAKYQVSVGDILIDDPIDASVLFEGKSGYKSRLCAAVAMYYGCQTVLTKRFGKKYITCVGRESARVTTELMYPFIYEQCRKAGIAIATRTDETVASSERRVVNALTVRLFTLIRQREPEVAGTPSGKNALIVVDAIQAKLKERFPNMTMGKARAITTSDLAHEAAAGVSLHRQTSHDEVRRLK